MGLRAGLRIAAKDCVQWVVRDVVMNNTKNWIKTINLRERKPHINYRCFKINKKNHCRDAVEKFNMRELILGIDRMRWGGKDIFIQCRREWSNIKRFCITLELLLQAKRCQISCYHRWPESILVLNRLTAACEWIQFMCMKRSSAANLAVKYRSEKNNHGL